VSWIHPSGGHLPESAITSIPEPETALELWLTYVLLFSGCRRIEAMSKELNELRSQGLKPTATSTTSTDDSGVSPDATGNSPSAAIPADGFELSVDAVEIGGTVISAETAIEVFKT
jgi:hypothetical protein